MNRIEKKAFIKTLLKQPALTRTLAGAGVGAGIGGVTGYAATDDPERKGGNAVSGAILGGIGGGFLGNKVGKMVKNPQAQKMLSGGTAKALPRPPKVISMANIQTPQEAAQALKAQGINFKQFAKQFHPDTWSKISPAERAARQAQMGGTHNFQAISQLLRKAAALGIINPSFLDNYFWDAPMEKDAYAIFGNKKKS